MRGPLGARGQLSGPLATTPVSLVTSWWLSGGIAAANCVAAYQPKGAASLAASYVNLNAPGTNDAFPGTAPSFNAATGWTFAAASSQYLKTGLNPKAAWSLIVQISNFSGLCTAAGIYYSATAQYYICPQVGTKIIYINRNEIDGANIASGNVCIAGLNAYQNGSVLAGTFLGTADLADSVGLTIGARRRQDIDGYDRYATGTIIALAIYSATLTAPQVAAVAAAMAAL